MKNSRIFKGGIILLSLALIVGMFSAIALADGNGTYGMRGGSSGNIESPRYGMQNKGASNQGQTQDCEGCEDCVEGQGNGMDRRTDAPDDDGDGIPNGQDADYVHNDCDDECDGTCDSEPKGNGWRRNSSDNVTELQAHVSGVEMKTMTIANIATLWGIEDSEQLLDGIKNEFKLTQEYNTNNTIDDLRGEYRFSPNQIMELAEKLKQI
ncbi:MAG: hypothetical protein U9N08_07020 [Candidatus Caldatribacteriota bacterium]|nr:hypothetical protein [Candidatus Caldatribacteriota bacterium]